MNESWREILGTIAQDGAKFEFGVPRDVLDDPKTTQLDRDLVTVISGVRRSGKSTLLRQIADRAKVVDRSLFINFEDPRLGDQLDHRLLDAIVAYQEARSSGGSYFFFDEIQNVRGWEKWLHIQLEVRRHHFTMTGSNAALLGSKVSTALTGRHRTIEMFPFSYREFRRLRPDLTFDDYVTLGGFPRVLVDIDGPSLLRDYFIDIIERDVRHHVAARSVTSLVQLGKALAESVGSETSFRRLAAAFDTSVETVKRYTEAFENAYLFVGCPYFAHSERKRSHRPKKYYCIDAGLRGAVSTQTGKDLGKTLEQAVFQMLRREYRHVYYWRDKHEIDFVVDTPEGFQPIQVSYHGASPRHADAAREFYKTHPKALPVRLIARTDAERLAETARFSVTIPPIG